MADVGSFIDPYTVTARFVPALVVMLPLWPAFAAWFPADKVMSAAFAAGGGAIALSVVLAQIGRDLGKKKQSQLFRDWGGTPTSLMISHCTTSLNPQTLQRYHICLRELVPGLHIPASKAEEEAEPAAARAAYESAIDYLRETTRDKEKFRMVAAENINYGFRRNLWAMKSAGILCCMIATAAVLIKIAWAFLSQQPIAALPVATLVISILLLTLWVLRFTRGWVRVAADEYAKQLLSACDTLHTDNRPH